MSVSKPAVPDPSHDPLAERRRPLIERLLRHARAGEVVAPPALPDLLLARVDQPQEQVCGVYEPCVALVVQGRKQVAIGEQVFAYDDRRFFVTPLELPSLATILDASPQTPFLSLALRLDLRLVATLMAEGVVAPPPPPGGARHAMSTVSLDPALLDAFGRLLALLDEPDHAAALAPLVQREITYRLLVGDEGWRLRQIAAVNGQGQQVSRAIGLLKARYSEALRIEDLARAASMSVSSLHHHFKGFTGMSPLQYQKQLRLSEARRLMFAEGIDAATAAYRVGYESPSQFSREYGRHFGAPPMRDIARLRDMASAGAA